MSTMISSSASDTGQSLFDSRNKLLCFSDHDIEAVNTGFPGDTLFDLYLVKQGPGDTDLTAVDMQGKSHSVFAPANGAVVLINPDSETSGCATRLLSLWKDAGISQPAEISVGNRLTGDNALEITKSLITQLGSELNTIAMNAVSLDEQVALLRSDLEDCRRSISELGITRRLAGEVPTLSFNREPSRSRLKLGKESLSQLLPYSGSIISSVAVYLSETENCSGGLKLSIVAREDDSTVASWVISSSDLKDGWNVVSLSSRISTRYRFLDLLVSWQGFDDETALIHLSDAFGDKDGFVVSPVDTVQNQMLSLRVWTGATFDTSSLSRFVHFPSEVSRVSEPVYRQLLPSRIVRSVKPAVEIESDLNWLSTADDGFMVHPTLPGPSIAQLDIPAAEMVLGMAMSISLEKAESLPVLFRVVVLEDVDAKAVYIDNPEAKNKSALYESGWIDVIPCTEVSIECSFDRPCQNLSLLIMTRSTGDNISYAHAWCRNIQLVY